MYTYHFVHAVVTKVGKSCTHDVQRYMTKTLFFNYSQMSHKIAELYYVARHTLYNIY